MTKTELNQQTARVLARVAAGETLTVTDRGRPIAELTPPATNVWADLVATGRVTLPRASGAMTIPPVKLEKSSRTILDEIRGDHL